MRVRKKPITVQAWENKPQEHTNEFPRWLLDAAASDIIEQHEDGHMFINTLEGKMRAEIGDFIIQGVNGELYPCKPDIFHKTYDII